MRRALLVAAASLLTVPAVAHELTPALLSIEERDPGRYDVSMRIPTDVARVRLIPIFPNVARLLPVGGAPELGVRVERWSLSFPGGLAGHSVRVEGPIGAVTDVLVRVNHLDGRRENARLALGGPPVTLSASPTRAGISASYFLLGLEHIATGWDHLAFVLSLWLLTGTGRRLVFTITAFTLAHSATLGLASLQIVTIPAAPVEAIIALSIVVLARELAVRGRGEGGLTWRYPWAVAFGFGSLHGLGFAGALAATGLPHGEVPLALATFNLGVEAGQLVFVGGLVTLARITTRLLPPATITQAPRPAAFALGSFAVALLCDRVVAFF